jgi:hypothetical protein
MHEYYLKVYNLKTPNIEIYICLNIYIRKIVVDCKVGFNLKNVISNLKI